MGAGVVDHPQWMSYLQDDIKVVNSYIPGSHDASAYPIGDASRDDMNTAAGAITQKGNYYEQLLAGSRYFDMRIVLWEGNLTMKHSTTYYERFDTVLQEIRKFSAQYPSEFVFMDLDFTLPDRPGVDFPQMVMETLLKEIGEDKFVRNHCLASGDYNKDLTWHDLREEAKAGRNMILIWPAGFESGKPWAPPADKMRDDWYGDFNKKSPDEILQWIDQTLANWKRERLGLTQLINTPGISILPWSHPEEKDQEAAELFTKWVMEKKNGDNLGVVKRDFVTKSWNREAIDHVILINKFTNDIPPLRPSGGPISYMDTVRLRTEDGRYFTVIVKSPPEKSYVILSDVPTASSNFLLRHYKYTSAWGFPYSGNEDADSNGANGNFRLAYLDGKVNTNNRSDIVISLDRNNQNCLYWGVGWGPADNWETFFLYDPESMNNDGQVYDGSRAIMRSNLDKNFCAVGNDGNGNACIYANVNEQQASKFIIERVPA